MQPSKQQECKESLKEVGAKVPEFRPGVPELQFPEPGLALHSCHHYFTYYVEFHPVCFPVVLYPAAYPKSLVHELEGCPELHGKSL